jgi:hypothetical protein
LTITASNSLPNSTANRYLQALKKTMTNSKMRNIIIFIFLLINFLAYGQDTSVVGLYYRKTALASLNFEIELKADYTYTYLSSTSWGGEFDKGVWTLNSETIRLISQDTTKAVKEYKCISQLPKRQIRTAKRKGNWAFLVKSKIIYDKNGERKKIIPEFDKAPYLDFVK